MWKPHCDTKGGLFSRIPDTAIVKRQNPITGINTDGIDLDGCQNVLISKCNIETGDDAICLTSDNPLGGSPRLARNIVVTNCIPTTCCNGFKIGTGSVGECENITFSNSVIYTGPFKERVISGVAWRLSTAAGRGVKKALDGYRATGHSGWLL